MTAAGFLKLFCTVLNGSTSGLYIVFGAFTNYHIINKALVIVIITFLVSSVKHKAQLIYGSTATRSTHHTRLGTNQCKPSGVSQK